MSNLTNNQKTKFFDAFNVKVEKQALVYMCAEPEVDWFSYTAPETFGDDLYVLIEKRNQDIASSPFLVLETPDAEELVTELIQVFALADFNTKAFIKGTREHYKDKNKA